VTRRPRPAHPDRQAASYRRRLAPYLRDMHEVTVGALEHAARVSGILNDAADAPGRAHHAMEAATRELNRRWSDKRLLDVVRPVGLEVDKLSRVNVARVAGIPVAEVPAAAGVDAWAARNAELVRSIETRYTEAVAEITSEGFKNGTRWEDLVPQLQERASVSESNAERIARTETARLNGELSRTRFEALGVTQAVWRTSRDERVRDSHAELEGQVYDLAEGIDGLFPATEPNCRCWDEPVVEL
jgi:SPP1 gp7 family putative phage head morphogenesis protein